MKFCLYNIYNIELICMQRRKNALNCSWEPLGCINLKLFPPSIVYFLMFLSSSLTSPSFPLHPPPLIWSLVPNYLSATSLTAHHSANISVGIRLPQISMLSVVPYCFPGGDLQTPINALEDGALEDALDWEEEKEMERMACEGDDFVPPKIMVRLYFVWKKS